VYWPGRTWPSWRTQVGKIDRTVAAFRDGGNRLVVWALALGVALTVGYLLLPSQDIQDISYQFVGMLAVVAVLFGIFRHRPHDVRPWLVFAAGLALTTAGDWTWVILERVYGLEPFPSVADGFYLGGTALVVIGIAWMVHGRIPDGDRAGILDSLIVTVGVGLVSWTFLMAPIVADMSASLEEIVFALAYPLLDILLLGVLIRIALAPGPRVPALRFLLAALISVLVADFAYAFIALTDGYYTGHIVDGAWLLASALWAAAALHPSMREVALPVTGAQVRFSAWRLVLLAAASLMAPVVLFIQWSAGNVIDVPIIAGGSVVLFLLVIVRLAGVVGDLRSTVTQQQRLETELERRALHDPLTGLANRVLFADRLAKALSKRDERVAVLFLDLDDFKTINDTQGHQAGDELLRAVADALSRSIRPEDTVARLGGDEFAVLMEDAREGLARRLADRMHAALRMPMRVAGQDRAIGVSIGIALGHSGTSEAESLMREADIAMYVAKGAGKGGSSVFDSRTHASVVRGLGLGDDLQRGITDHQFELEYQPIVDLRTGTMAGVEALVRWRHPVRGLLPPDDFIPVAESTGMIVDLGKWIISEACRQAVAWSEAPNGLLAGDRFMSINLSTVQLTDPRFVEFVTETLERSGVTPRQLMLEVTESANPDAEVVADTLRLIHDMGVRLAIDDFGTGYASMSRLANIPFEIIKIDISLVGVVDTDARTQSVITGITDLARRLGARTVAEGVERTEQLAPLRQMSCDLAQGFHFTPSLPPAAFEAFLAPDGEMAPIPNAAPVPRPAT